MDKIKPRKGLQTDAWSIKAMSGQRSNLLNRKDLSIKRTTLSQTEELEAR